MVNASRRSRPIFLLQRFGTTISAYLGPASIALHSFGGLGIAEHQLLRRAVS